MEISKQVAAPVLKDMLAFSFVCVSWATRHAKGGMMQQGKGDWLSQGMTQRKQHGNSISLGKTYVMIGEKVEQCCIWS